jgi:hypothetical protein
MAGTIHFPILAPPLVKKGESVKILLGTIPASPLPPNAGCETIEVYIVDPSGRVLPQQITVEVSIGTVTYSANYFFRYVFPSNGTFTVYAKVTTPPVPDIYIGFGLVHVPEWLNNIDAPISDINKQTRENSRLRTDIARKGGAFSS